MTSTQIESFHSIEPILSLPPSQPILHPFGCKFCGKITNSRRNMNRHIKRVHIKQKTKCPYCDKIYLNICNHRSRCKYKKLLKDEEDKNVKPFYQKYYPVVELMLRYSRSNSDMLFVMVNKINKMFTKYILSLAEKRLEQYSKQKPLENQYEQLIPVHIRELEELKKEEVDTSTVEQTKEIKSLVEQIGMFEVLVDKVLIMKGKERTIRKRKECEFNKDDLYVVKAEERLNKKEKLKMKCLINYISNIINENKTLQQCPYCHLYFKYYANHIFNNNSCSLFKKFIFFSDDYEEQLTYVANCISNIYNLSKESIIEKYKEINPNVSCAVMKKNIEVMQLIKDIRKICKTIKNEMEQAPAKAAVPYKIKSKFIGKKRRRTIKDKM